MKIQIGRNIFINKPINAHRIDQTQTLAVYALRSNRKQRVGHKNVKEKDDKKTYEQRFLCLGWDGTNTWKYTERYQSITNGMTTETKRLKSKRNESKLKCSSLIFVADKTQSTRICAFKKSLYISFSRLKHNPWVFKLKLVERFKNLCSTQSRMDTGTKVKLACLQTKTY